MQNNIIQYAFNFIDHCYFSFHYSTLLYFWLFEGMWTSKFICKHLVFNCIYIHSNQIFIYFYMINCNIIVCVGKLLNKCSFTTFKSLSNIYFIEHNEISLLTSKRWLSIQFENNIFTPNWSYQFFFSRLVNVIIGLFVTFNFVHSYYFSRITHLIKSSSPITIEPGANFLDSYLKICLTLFQLNSLYL